MPAPPVTDPAELRRRARCWAELDPDPENEAEIEAILQRSDPDEMAARFGTELAFGTAGLRAEVGAGPMRMNCVVARHTAEGVAAVMHAREPDCRRRGVVVAHDARRGSNSFSATVVDTFRSRGIDVHLVDGPAPTPLAAFALRQLGAGAAIVVTASHNPASDNGIKVYWEDGAQIAPPLDAEIDAAIARARLAALGSVGDEPLVVVGPDPGRVHHLGSTETDSELVRAYVAAALALVPGPPAHPLPLAATSLHGVGAPLLDRVLRECGHGPVHHVAEQRDPDPRFGTVEFPNPEEPGALDLLFQVAARTGSAIAMANDPDADRLAVAAEARDGRWQALTGDQLGALLAWRMLELTEGIEDRLLVNSVVSSRLLSAMAEDAGVHYAETLTGFKWLSRPATEHPQWHQLLAYEEALGYALGPETRDKDGITAALVAADAACALAESGRTVWDVLDDLARRHGAHVTDNGSVRLRGDGAGERLEALTASLLTAPPDQLGGVEVESFERLAPEVFRIRLEDGTRVALRPSGTEPKFKYYCEAVEPVATGEHPSKAANAAAVRLGSVVEALRARLA